MPPHYTPVIPPRPSPEGANSPMPDPPVIPVMSPQNQPNSPPNWARPTHPQATPAGFPGYFQTPYVQPQMQMPPGSYYIPPVALPQGATPATGAVGVDGLSTDWEGFPTNIGGGPPAGPPQGAPWGFAGAAGFGTPYPQPMAFGGWPTPGPGGAPAFAPTPYMTAVPGAWATPFTPANQQLPPGFPQPAAPQQQQQQQQHGRNRPVRPTENMPPVDKFAEDPRCKLPIPFLL